MAEITPFFAVEAEELFENEKYDEAIDLCKKGIAVYPKYPTAYGVLAQALLFVGDENEARTTVEKGLSQNPGNKFLKNIIDNFFTPAEMPENLVDSDEHEDSDEYAESETDKSTENISHAKEIETEPEIEESPEIENDEFIDEENLTEIIPEEELAADSGEGETESIDTKSPVEEEIGAEETGTDNSEEEFESDTLPETVEAEPQPDDDISEQLIGEIEDDSVPEDERNSNDDDELELLSGIIEEGGHEEFDYSDDEILEENIEESGTDVDNRAEENLENISEDDMRKPKPQKGEQMSLQFIIDNSRNKKFRNYSVRSDDFSIMPWVEPQKNITRYRTQNPLATRKFSVSVQENDFTEAETAKIENDIETKANVITETIANILVKQGAYRQAIEAFNKLVEKHPDRADKFLEKINELESFAK